MFPADMSLSVAERVDAACDHFESEWKRGTARPIDSIVAAAPASDREELRKALLGLERELQERSAAETSVSQSSVRTGEKPSPTVTTEHVAPPSESMIGRFEIRNILGSGAFGKVYRAFDPQLGREVAVKVPLEETVRTEAERARFLKEARSAGTINHPNVCQVHEVGEADGRPYIVMTLVRGQSLADTIKARKSPLPAKQIALVIRKIALALSAAHDCGIVHRDLKPANIMFDRERKDIVVMDFGLARGPKLGDARGTQSGIIMGTPAYMSPEQARGDAKGVGPSGDIFSLGVILYELLTGTRPFTGTATEVIGKILHVDPEKPSTVRKDVDARLEAMCLKAMAKDPADRYASMQELATELDTFLRKPNPDADTVKSQQTRRTDAGSSTSNNLAEVFAALSNDRKQAHADTAAVVEAAFARNRLPRWAILLLGLLLAVGLAALASVIFFTRSEAVKVDLAIIINDVNLKDQSLSFFLDDKPITAEALARPVELQPGLHTFVVKKGNEIVKRVAIRVEGGKTPGIKIEADPQQSAPSAELKKPELKLSPLDRLKSESIPERLLTEVYGTREKAPKELVAIFDTVIMDRKDLNGNVFGGFALDRSGGSLAHSRYPYTIIEMNQLATGRIFNTIATDPGGWIGWLRFSPDNQSIYYQRRNNKLIGCNIGGKIRWEQAVRAENFSVPALSPDGTIVVAADPDLKEDTLNVFDAQSGDLKATWKGILDKPMCRLTFSPDGSMLAVQSGGVVKFVSPKDGTALPIAPVERTSGEVRFSTDGKRLYWSVSWRQPEDYCVEYEIATGKRTEYRRAPDGCREIQVNAVFPLLATNDAANHLHFWDAIGGPQQQPHVISTGDLRIERMLFTPEGRYLVVGALNRILIFRLPVDRPVIDWNK